MYNLIHSTDSAGFYYSDLLANATYKVGDDFHVKGIKSTIFRIDLIETHKQAVASMLAYKRQYKKHNVKLDPEFITRTGRSKETF